MEETKEEEDKIQEVSRDKYKILEWVLQEDQTIQVAQEVDTATLEEADIANIDSS